MQEFKTASDLEELLDYLRNPGGHITHRETVHSKKMKFVLSIIGRLYIEEYRMVQFLKKDAFLLTRMSFAEGKDSSHCIVYVLEENTISSNRQQRLKLLEGARKLISNLPMKGTYRVIILYCNNASYSELSQEQLRQEMAPPVHHLKNQRFYPEMDGKRPLNCKEIGTKLHSVVEKYILGAGSIRSMDFLNDLKRYKLRYNINTVTHTINYIIAKEMLEGGYEVIGSEKLYMVRVSPPNFNRLDLLLRRKDKVLVIDWKFTKFSARDYIKSYRYKVRKYLKIAKKQYDCEVEFQLYCIHQHLNGFMYNFSVKKELLPKHEVIVSDCSDAEPQQELDEEVLAMSDPELQVASDHEEEKEADHKQPEYLIIDDD